MKVVLLGNMVASGQAFDLLSLELTKRGYEVKSFLAYGKSYNVSFVEMYPTLVKAEALVLGTASSPKLAVEELEAAKMAINLGIPFALYADTYNSWNREWFHEATKQAAALFVINEKEAKKARAVFPGVNVVASGNPTWEAFAYPSVSREAVRAKLGIADHHERLILCPFGKSFVVNAIHAGAVINALAKLDSRCKMIIAHHPGDKNPPEVYADLALSKKVAVKIVAKQEMSTSEIVVGADLVIDSASTIGIQAAHLRIPVISYFSEVALARLEHDSGSREWEPCKLGIAYPVLGDHLFHEAIASFFRSKGIMCRYLRERQEAVYPVSGKKGEVCRKMADTLEAIAKK